jgi:hypothetical protein
MGGAIHCRLDEVCAKCGALIEDASVIPRNERKAMLEALHKVSYRSLHRTSSAHEGAVKSG